MGGGESKEGSGSQGLDVNNDGKVDLQDKLLEKGFAVLGLDGNVNMTRKEYRLRDDASLNKMIVFTWPFFAMFLLLQPWLSNWANNAWYSYSAIYTVYNADGSVEGNYERPGICDTKAEFMHCTDGQNFTALALKYRGKAVGCGCGEGVLGEGLCPMTSYGYTLSDFVSTEPAIAAMLGLGFFPLLGTWLNTMIINRVALPSPFVGRMHMRSMSFFQLSYVLWGIASDCIFPTSHAILTVAFLGGFLWHWVITAFICIAHWGVKNFESCVTLYVSLSSIVVISIGAIPRVFLTLNSVLGTTIFPNWNRGIGAYAFWIAEAGGLSLTFGAYPILIIGFQIFPESLTGARPNAYRLWESDTITQETEYMVSNQHSETVDDKSS